jgi:predicted ATPase
LAAVNNPALVRASIAETLGVNIASGGSLARQVTAVLAPRQLLLVLDNFEHLVDGAPLIAELLAVAPRLSVLATSRVRLRLSAEHVYRVPGLDVPDVAASVAQLDTNDAIQLFVDRARAVDTGFALSETDRPHVAEICRRLSGIPLALSLAASRVSVLPVSEIAARIDRQLPLLTGGSRDLPDRQRSMRDTIAWSYGLLAPAEQTLLRWLAPFVGGFTLDFAEATAQVAGLPPDHTLDLISTLVESALVVPSHAANGSPRFQMLETIREYGLEQLAELGELDDAQLAHARHILAFASDGAPTPSEHQDLGWVHRLAIERDDLVAAFDRVCQPEHAELCLQIAAVLGPYWDIHGPFEEGWERMQRAIALSSPDPSLVKGHACYWGALLGGWRNDFSEAIAIAELGIVNAQALGDATALADALHIRALLELFQYHWDAAAPLFERELELLQELGNPFAQGRSLLYLAGAHYGKDDFPRARIYIEQAAQCFRVTGFPEWIAPCDWYFGLFAVAEGRIAVAAVSFAQSLRDWLVDDLPSGEFKPMVGLADVAAATGLPEHAARMLGATDHILETTDGKLQSFDVPGYERATAFCRSTLTPARFAACRDEGRRMRPDELLTEASAIVAAARAIA